jgi:spore germination protein YaaH
MTRRGAQLPWGGRGTRGLYGGGGRSNGYGRIAVLAVIAAGVLVLGYVLFSLVRGGDDCTTSYCASSQEIAPPEGSEFATKIYAYNEKKAVAPGNDVLLRLPLSKATTDARNLSFYRYVPETKLWEPITAAILDGSTVNATLHDTPKLLAVLRRNSPGGSVVAYLPHRRPDDPNGELHPDAAGKITMLHTRDFTPAAGGGVDGELSAITADSSFQFIPVISARTDIKGSVEVVRTLLSNPSSRSTHVQNILKKVTEGNLAGIDVEYLDLTVNDRTSFSLFVSELARFLHSQNKQLTLTLPPPIKTADRIDEGAYDWAELGQAADMLQITPYRDQGKYRTDMPDILQYLAQKVQPSTKLVLTVTPYATEKGDGLLRTMTITDAMNIATKLSIRTGADQKLATSSVVDIVGVNINKADGRSGMLWDANTATVAFTYEQNGGRTIWLENFFSVGFKLEFISRFKLGGVAIEDASKNTYLGNIWTALLPYITSGQVVLMQPNPQDLQPVWATSKGSFEDTRKGAIKWSTPAEPGTYTITLTLSDGVARFQSEIPASPQARDTKTPTAGATPGG